MTRGILYLLCTLTALLCSILLGRAYSRSRYRLLLWGAISFAGFTLNNALLVVDKLVLGPEISLFTIRLVVACLSVLVLLYGIIWDAE